MPPTAVPAITRAATRSSIHRQDVRPRPTTTEPRCLDVVVREATTNAAAAGPFWGPRGPPNRAPNETWTEGCRSDGRNGGAWRRTSPASVPRRWVQFCGVDAPTRSASAWRSCSEDPLKVATTSRTNHRRTCKRVYITYLSPLYLPMFILRRNKTCNGSPSSPENILNQNQLRIYTLAPSVGSVGQHPVYGWLEVISPPLSSYSPLFLLHTTVNILITYWLLLPTMIYATK